jgi:hypothetical protein
MSDDKRLESLSEADFANLDDFSRFEQPGAPPMPTRLHFESLEDLDAETEAYLKEFHAWEASKNAN